MQKGWFKGVYTEKQDNVDDIFWEGQVLEYSRFKSIIKSSVLDMLSIGVLNGNIEYEVGYITLNFRRGAGI